MNVEKARLDKIYGNAEIKAMITAFGTGIHEDFDISKLRYHKIIIMTDADVDGAHISTLMLTFIYRFMPELIKSCFLYIQNLSPKMCIRDRCITAGVLSLVFSRISGSFTTDFRRYPSTYP